MDGLGRQCFHREFTRRKKKKNLFLKHIIGREEQSCLLIYSAAHVAVK